MANFDLIFPVYINQRTVFDFVATMQDGIATVTRATVSEAEERSAKSELSGSFGLGAALTNFFKIDAKAGKSTGDTATIHSEQSEDRYQTPTSLLARLISTLRETRQLHPFSTIDSTEVGQLVEFQAVLSRSPMIETLDRAMQGWDLVFGLQQKQVAKPNKNQHQQTGVKTLDPGAEFGINVARHLLSDLQRGKTTDIISSELSDGVRAVVTLEREFLSDPSMANLLDGKFRVLGKVIRKISNDSGGINLLRNSTIGKLNSEFVGNMITAVQQLQQFVAMGSTEVEIKGPAIHILPVAIYS